MANKRVSMLILFVLVFYIPSNAVANEESNVVPQFGVSFDEVVVADSTDGLSDPRDLEFHPGRANELWVANRATDSISIIHNTGLDNQTSENRQDSHKNHFLEEVSAIAFGSYHEEFDWQWGSAQESVNTYCGQGSPNNFMGPTLWPSSLSHFAMEHQNDQYLGSHIDMNHESPFGVGIAHDSDNSYWYNDGYYGELVYYDFQEDHDTGMDDHSDAIVRRYSDVQLTHSYGTPGHMILDKDSGILYISDPGANRVLWVNTDDATYNTEDIMAESSRLEPLAEYSRITGIEWGVLDSGMSKPSGIALDGDQLFVSEKGSNQIIAYDLSTDGKSATEAGSIQTSASAIMGLEIGPNGHIYYVDNGQDEVVRIDPLADIDDDGVIDQDDNCPQVANANQENHDSDLQGDACDEDDDNDGILDASDYCATGNLDWTPSLSNDHDGDGCRDASEDYDDDNDGVMDNSDRCSSGELNWLSGDSNDYDGDGCKDSSEDKDDDNDNICDSGSDSTWDCMESTLGTDFCPTSHPTFTSTLSSDADQDGCEDRNEDLDDDNDNFLDGQDDCPIQTGFSNAGRLFGCPDSDSDGYADTIDQFPDESSQWSDIDEDGFGDQSDGV
ncbi:thrombospondin type 3 repeat-containing protein, partial [Candidatus Poseidoniaceae archaeon]|nr:thrombospondin type 3 repeat-containing protein [Candidatus Poseidoniaceae archaeon]